MSVQQLPSGRWRVRYTRPDGSQATGGTFATQKLAIQAEGALIAEVKRGAYIDDRMARKTFGEAAEHYLSLAEVRLRPTSYGRDLSHYQTHIGPRWADVQLNKINGSDVENWIASLSKEGSNTRTGGTLMPRSARKVVVLFRAILGHAVSLGWIAKIPGPTMKKAAIPKEQRKDVQPLTEAEAVHLANCFPDRLRAWVIVSAFCGLRQSESFALKVNDLDFNRCRIRVDEGVVPDRNGALHWSPTKTDGSYRYVPAPDIVIDALREHVDEYVGWDDPGALVFMGEKGGALRRSNFRQRIWNPALAESGLRPITPHDLRHTAASLMIASGAPALQVAKALGHKDTRMIDSTYGHLFPDETEAMRQRMSERARQAQAPGKVIPIRRTAES